MVVDRCQRAFVLRSTSPDAAAERRSTFGQLGRDLCRRPQRPTEAIQLYTPGIRHPAAIWQVASLEQSRLRLNLLQKANDAFRISGMPRTSKR